MRADVLIAGGGATGALLAIHLLRTAQREHVIVIAERSGRFGEGLAYSTRDPLHLMNVPARALSAISGLPDDFVEWLAAKLPGSTASTFAPRQLYGAYLAESLALAQSASAAQLVRIPKEVTDAAETASGVRAKLADGSSIDASFAVLALGNPPPANPNVPDGGLYESGLYRRSPWGSDALDDLAPDAPVLLIGTGLTMVDTALSLSRRGHRGVIHALSRHGLLPARHERHAPPPTPWIPKKPTSVRALLRELREQPSWRNGVDGLRPLSQRLWAGLEDEERARFLRHLRLYWDVHRHRMAPEVADAIALMRSSGQLQVAPGRLIDFQLEPFAAIARYRPRGSKSVRSMRIARVINCTGPACLRSAGGVLVQRLLTRGLLCLDGLGLGIEAAFDGACFDRRGTRSAVLYAAGPLLRGVLWESTAIPEIRAQAEALSERLLLQLEGTTAGLAHA
ncbi:MAG TPA: FAD/NAD(P)-binding protein [Myxococcales bacterium]|jgi:uncharacterized NAD(P)/FAD-binding protein YdhS